MIDALAILVSSLLVLLIAVRAAILDARQRSGGQVDDFPSKTPDEG